MVTDQINGQQIFMEKLLVTHAERLCGRGEDRTQYLSACESNALSTKLSCPPIQFEPSDDSVAQRANQLRYAEPEPEERGECPLLWGNCQGLVDSKKGWG
jgi:hypothetical protein